MARCPATKADGSICLRDFGHGKNLFPDDGHNWQPPMGKPVPEAVACSPSEPVYQQQQMLATEAFERYQMALVEIGMMQMTHRKLQDQIAAQKRTIDGLTSDNHEMAKKILQLEKQLGERHHDAAAR